MTHPGIRWFPCQLGNAVGPGNQRTMPCISLADWTREPAKSAYCACVYIACWLDQGTSESWPVEARKQCVTYGAKSNEDFRWGRSRFPHIHRSIGAQLVTYGRNNMLPTDPHITNSMCENYDLGQSIFKHIKQNHINALIEAIQITSKHEPCDSVFLFVGQRVGQREKSIDYINQLLINYLTE